MKAPVRYYPGSIQMMPAAKRSISFDGELLARAERVAERETGGNLSALVGEALEQRVRHSDLRALVKEDIESIGGIPPEIRAQARREWDDAKRRWADEEAEWAAHAREE